MLKIFNGRPTMVGAHRGWSKWSESDHGRKITIGRRTTLQFETIEIYSRIFGRINRLLIILLRKIHEVNVKNSTK